jgi:hypothetical protein
MRRDYAIVGAVKVREAMRNQEIPDIVEHLDFHTNLEAMCTAIAAEVSNGAYIPDSPIRFLAEKSKGLCRQIVIPAIKDALILQTLSDALWDEIRNKAPSKNAFYAPNDHSFSKMIRGQTSEYGPLHAWLLFQEKIFGFTKQWQYVVVTDIANFYDNISYGYLRNILADLSLHREHSLDLLVYTLSHMLWQPDYMPRVQIGMPQMNLDAPRLLAHSFLFEIDKLLESIIGTNYARYMDDIDIGTDSKAHAKAILRDLDLSLQTRQIRLNSGKTIILTNTAVQKHYRIRDNAFLSRQEDALDVRLSLGVNTNRYSEFLRDITSKCLKNGYFIEGNGEKILKRCINYSRKYKIDMDNQDFLTLLVEWPSLRKTILQWWLHSDHPETKLEFIRDFVCSQEIIDDAALINTAVSLVAAGLPATAPTSLLIDEITHALDEKTLWGLFAKTWILSKYGTNDELMRVVGNSVPIWVTAEHPSRLVGGLYPRMLGTSNFDKFMAVIARSGSRWSQIVAYFHEAISREKPSFRAVLKFVSGAEPVPACENLTFESSDANFHVV